MVLARADPFGKLTVLDGDPGLGKSTLALDLAARASIGAPLPEGPRASEPCGVVILSAEDGIADTILPRLAAHGADLNRIFVLASVPEDDGDERPPEIPRDLTRLGELTIAKGARLVVIDPLMAFLAGGVNANRDQDVRRVLYALALVAERTGAAIVVIRHLNKSGGSRALYRGGGSIGIVGAARSAMLVSQDPGDASVRVLASQKSNLARSPESLAFQLVTDHDRQCGRVAWRGTSPHSADDLLRLASQGEDDRSALAEAEEFLRVELVDGPQPVKQLKEAALEVGISEKTLQRAKESLGVVSDKLGFKGGWTWALPTQAAEDSQGQPTTLTSSEVDHLRSNPHDEQESPEFNPSPTPEDGQPVVLTIFGCERPVTILGDEGYASVLRRAYRMGHITNPEWLSRLTLHHSIQRVIEAGADA